MNIGDIITSDGRTRKIIAFTTVNGEKKPVTEPYKGEVKAEIKEAPKGAEYNEFVCQFCGKVCQSALGLTAHERNCKKNPNRVNK